MSPTSLPPVTQLLIGTYTEALAGVEVNGEGIVACDYTAVTPGPPTLAAPTRNPSYLAVSPDGRYVYAANEVADFDGGPGGGLTAFSRDPTTGALTELNCRSTRGVDPCHVALDATGMFVLVANYTSGSVIVFARNRDGSLGEVTGYVQHVGAGVDPERQEGPHAHMVMVDPVTAEVLVTDLGQDAVLTYQLSSSGALTERTDARITTAPGSGPRHLAFHPDGRALFLVSELDNVLTAFRRDGNRFVPTGSASTLPAGFVGTSYAAAVRVAASGRFVFVSNRGDESDSVAMLRFDEPSGHLELVAVEPTQGRQPRDFIVTADGEHLVVANQGSDSLVVFAVAEDPPSLDAISVVPVPTPVCLVAT